ncbi:MAG: 3-deoxy-manno-octulosonate cytidylyltransferase [Alphaproteobacteria bacterium]|nr:3-deoxy-manno-octulosonate cytidylyltransferase [Alphaproteobacteria bacterium]
MKFAIAIPARYGSTRFPGKPLAMIKGRTMLSRVVDLARRAAKGDNNIEIFVTTEDKRIEDHAKELGVVCIHTPASCLTGSDRVLSALRQLDDWPNFVINLQGDAPFTPVSVIQDVINTACEHPRSEVITPVHQLSWDDLDRLRNTKKETPFSGTTATICENGRALWFSKNIMPAIRKEEALRMKEELSPVYQHIGLYCFRSDILEKFCTLPQSKYEKLEGLEQLRMLENNIHIDTVKVKIPHGHIQSGIDSPEDVVRAEAFLDEYGEQAA